MALGVSPGRVREVRFAEQWRGYRTDEVDEFVEQVAETFDQLEARIRESSDRAAEAERRLLERGLDEDLSRTLILAQRTADAARQEAEAEAKRLVSETKERARLLMEEAENRRASLDEEIEVRVQAELGDVAERRAALERDVASLASFLEHERGRLANELRAQLTWLEQLGSVQPTPPPLSSSPSGSGVASSPVAGAGPQDPEVAGTGVADDTLALVVPASLGTSHRSDDTALDDLETPWRSSDDNARSDDDHSDDDRSDDDRSDDDALVAQVAPGDGSVVEAADSFDDPFLTELRRAATDPEPLGPRDDAVQRSEWSNEVDVYDEGRNSTRFRRRRKR